MTLRSNLTPEKLRAHRLLDLARLGLPVAERDVLWALVVLGDAAG